MSRLLLLGIILLLGCFPIHASDAASAMPTPVTDPAQVAAHYHQVLTRPEYHEFAEPDVGSQLKDWLSLWFMKLGRRFGEFQYTGQMPAFASLLMTVLAIFAIAGLLYIMTRLTRRRIGMEASPLIQDSSPKTFRPPEFYDNEIQQAILNGNWHSAWLAAWRQFLSRLEDRRLVERDRTRTNREYLAQLRAQPMPASVLTLLIGMVDAYDRTIYGRKLIAEADWNRFHEQIQEAALLLHLNDKNTPVQRQREA